MLWGSNFFVYQPIFLKFTINICIFEFKTHFTSETFLIWALVFVKIEKNEMLFLKNKKYRNG